MPDRGAVSDHFASAIAAYRRAAGAEKWTPVEIDARHLGEHSVFATVHWNALDPNGQVVRDTWTSYQLLATPDGWPLSLVHQSLLTRAARAGAIGFRAVNEPRGSKCSFCFSSSS
jgi:hypothetical protein